jgi:2-oxoglutarate dehydrogenase complex dehydrogenase (E1) component-like enzyme
MNKQQRKEAEAMADKVRDVLEEAQQFFEDMASEERDKFDNMPEGLQQGERGQAIEQAADGLECAASAIQDALDSIDGNITDALSA